MQWWQWITRFKRKDANSNDWRLDQSIRNALLQGKYLEYGHTVYKVWCILPTIAGW